MTWQPKPRNWRRYFGYRPPRYERTPMTATELKRQAEAYVEWLAASRGWTLSDAEAHVAATRN